MSRSLIEKYNISVPRYTSYPTVPNWMNQNMTEKSWFSSISKRYASNPELSLYIHLPFCEQLCTFCGCNKRITKNHGYELPYIDAVLREWAMYLNHLPDRPVIKELHLGGGTPTFFSPKNLNLLVNGILSKVEVSSNYHFSFEAHPNSTSNEHLQTLYDLGFRRISIGVQDISQVILKAINRNQKTEEVTRVTNEARRIGYDSINYDIIYGLPFQKPIDVLNTVQFIEEYMPNRIAFYSYAHVPWKSAAQRAFTIENIPKGNYKRDLYELGKVMLEDLDYTQIGMDHFCLSDDVLTKSFKQGKMHRNFMGYTPSFTASSIGLGASAISDSWDMYVQNEPHLEKYQSMISDGVLPLHKSHTLSNEEMIMRKHILELMCRDYTYWSTRSKDHALIKPSFKDLIQLKQDGLIDFTSNSITVSQTGKYFIRNICAAIDPDFNLDTISEDTFSQAI